MIETKSDLIVSSSSDCFSQIHKVELYMDSLPLHRPSNKDKTLTLDRHRTLPKHLWTTMR